MTMAIIRNVKRDIRKFQHTFQSINQRNQRPSEGTSIGRNLVRVRLLSVVPEHNEMLQRNCVQTEMSELFQLNLLIPISFVRTIVTQIFFKAESSHRQSCHRRRHHRRYLVHKAKNTSYGQRMRFMCQSSARRALFKEIKTNQANRRQQTI